MATIRRNPMSAGTNSLSEQYMNFLEYKGLNTNKNYVSIDQETFTEVNNMYVNQENQLSTRPPIEIFVASGGNTNVIKIWKVNDKTFYHVVQKDDVGNIYVSFMYPTDAGGLLSISLTENEATADSIHFCWFNYAYALFTKNKLYCISYDNTGAVAVTESSNDAVYFPITKLHNGANIYTVDNPDPTSSVVLQNANVLTTGYRERYLFNNDITTPTGDIENKTVTIRIDNDTYTIKWQPYIEKVFYKRFGYARKNTKNIRYWNVQQTNDTTIYLAVDNDNKDDYLECYISNDGNTWYPFNLKQLYDISKLAGSTLKCPMQIPVVDNNCKYVYAVLYDTKANNTSSTINTLPDKVNIYRKSIFENDISTLNLIDWTLYQTVEISGTSAATHPHKNIDVVYSTSSIKYWGTYDTPGAKNAGSYIKNTFTAFGSCTNDTIAYCFSYVMNAYLSTGSAPDPDPDEVSTAENYMIVIADGERSDTKLFVRSAASPGTFKLYDSNLFYAANNVNNKIQVFMSGNTGVLSLYLNGATIQNSTNNTGDIARRDKLVTIIDSNFKITGYYTHAQAQPEFVASPYYSTFVPAIKNGDTPKLWNIDTGTETGWLEFYIDCYIENLTALFGISTQPFDEGRNKIDGDDPIRGIIYKYILSNISQVADAKYYAYDYSNVDGINIRINSQYNCTVNNSKHYIDDSNITDIKLSLGYALTDSYLYNIADNLRIAQLKPGRPVYVNNKGVTIWQIDTDLYTNQYTNTIEVDYTNVGEVKYILPQHSVDFITTCLSQDNVFYQSSKSLYDVDKTAGKNLFYIPEVKDKQNVLTDKITALVNFSQTALGIFLETTAYQFTYDSANDNYYLSKTKLSLGNRDGADMLLSYDGNNIYITTLKGLSTLNYQDFVQSTEQIYKYLTEAIMDTYQRFAKEPIKLCQYKDYLLLYHTDSMEILVFDLRTASWWKWTLPIKPAQIVYNNDNRIISEFYEYQGGLTIISDKSALYVFNFEKESVYDGTELVPFDWSFTTQKMHFGAPNNYKHIRSVSIVTEQSGRPLRFKLKFTNYRNLNNLSDSDTVEYDIDQLTTMIKRVNFIKTNAFQLQVSNDKTDEYAQAFVTPNIAIKYRITERLR